MLDLVLAFDFDLDGQKLLHLVLASDLGLDLDAGKWET